MRPDVVKQIVSIQRQTPSFAVASTIVTVAAVKKTSISAAFGFVSYLGVSQGWHG